MVDNPRDEPCTSVGRHEALDRRSALRYYTAAGPYVTFEEDRRGTLAPGQLADLVVLDGDPLEVGFS